MLHAIIGLILLIFLICHLIQRATDAPAKPGSGQRLPCPPFGAGNKNPERWHKPTAPTPRIPQSDPYKTPFVRSVEPFKAEKKLTTTWETLGVREWKDNYPYRYGTEVFRSEVEAEWARGFDQLKLQWDYEPMRFDMGPEYFSYTPDFRVPAISILDSNRPLYIEVKWFGEEMDLTKYVHFTEWYDCDLLVLAHFNHALWQKSKRWKKRPRPSVLKPEARRYYLMLRCKGCDRYIDFPCGELPTEDFKPLDLELRWQFASCVCLGRSVERIIVNDDFLIQVGPIVRGQVVLPEISDQGISYMHL